MAKLLLIAALAFIGWLRWRGRKVRLAMPLEEARALLGVDAGADGDAVRAAHRRIIARVHPDAGGSADLARRTNLARDLLLAELAGRPPASR